MHSILDLMSIMSSKICSYYEQIFSGLVCTKITKHHNLRPGQSQIVHFTACRWSSVILSTLVKTSLWDHYSGPPLILLQSPHAPILVQYTCINNSGGTSTAELYSYSSTYVLLKSMLNYHISCEHSFVCFCGGELSRSESESQNRVSGESQESLDLFMTFWRLWYEWIILEALFSPWSPKLWIFVQHTLCCCHCKYATLCCFLISAEAIFCIP